MNGNLLRRCVGLLLVAGLAVAAAFGATQNVDLDGQTANGAESQCDMNVLQTFPVKIENKVTNKAVGNAYTFSWKSAGPGAFVSSVTAGTTAGVGAKWVWTTNQTVYAYTGSSCANDICFGQTEGAGPIVKTCSLACIADGAVVTVVKGASAGEILLTWSGGQGPFTVYRSSSALRVIDPANAVSTTALQQYSDLPPSGGVFFYVVRGVDCATRKPCGSDLDCDPVTEGTCVNRGPFSVPGRSLYANDVTVSSASLTSSLITFFSPPKEVFRVTSTAQPGGLQETFTNNSTAPVTVVTQAYPPGCCPVDPAVPQQLRCGETCVDFLNDPANCGACGNVCGEGTCCSNGSCESLCAEGMVWCDGACVDLQDDSSNCGACGNVCGDDTCCFGGACASVCAEGETWCDGLCADLQDDSANCGACGNVCGDGTCCSNGTCASVCSEGQTWCNGQCVDFQNDNANCGTCGNVCGESTCCSNGTCASVCAEGQTWCNGQCVDFQNDNGNCGACGVACGEGTCCGNGTCNSVCAEGQTWCDGLCADLQDDSANCGACGNSCGDGTCCNDGTCASVCAEGQTWCNGQCADFLNDSANCGACGNVCGEGTCCGNGTCNSVCAEGQTWCNGQCVDFQNDNGNCGACGVACGEGTCCGNGTCNSVCAEGQTWCDGACADLQDDSANCGACGNSCGDGTCCSNGTCASVCGEGQTWCNGQCVDFQSDSANCGACGNACGDGTCCNGGSCVSECPEGRIFCDGQCIDIVHDRHNCGSCGHSCDHEEYCSGGTCHEEDDGDDHLSSYDPIPAMCPNPNPTAPAPGFCPNPNPTTPAPGFCPNPNPSSGPVPGVCSNPNPTEPVPGACSNPSPSSPVGGVCPNPDPSSGPVPGACSNPYPTEPVPGMCPNPNPSVPVGGVCPNPDPSAGPREGACPNPDPSSPAAGVCPSPGEAPPPAEATPNCQAEPTTTTIPPGGSATTCLPGGLLYKEVPTVVSVCGDSLPGPDGTCQNGISHVSEGTFMRLVPDTGRTVGNAYVTPYAVRVVDDTSGDGMVEPGESAGLVIDVLNAGPVDLAAASATLVSPPLDLADDGVNSPIGIAITTASSSYGTVLGTVPYNNCEPPALRPASNAVPFQVVLPPDHPGDTSRPFTLQFSGTVNGSPFSMDVPISLGIADRCSFAAATRDFDGLDGLSSPMAKLVPAGDPVPFPTSEFSAGNTRPLKLRMTCGGVNLTDDDVDAPEIVGLSEATRGPLDIRSLLLNSDDAANPNNPFFRFNSSLAGPQWNYNLRTSLIGKGRFTLTIRIAGRKEYVTGFVLK